MESHLGQIVFSLIRNFNDAAAWVEKNKKKASNRDNYGSMTRPAHLLTKCPSSIKKIKHCKVYRYTKLNILVLLYSERLCVFV